jgi:PASTA domain
VLNKGDQIDMSEQHAPEFEDQLRALLARAAEAIPADTELSTRVRQAPMPARQTAGFSGITGLRTMLSTLAVVLVVALFAGGLTYFHLGHTLQPTGKPTGAPLPTATVKPNASVTASTGPSLIIVPDVVGQPYSQAIPEIEQVGLQVVGQGKTNSTLPFGEVISTSPPAGTRVAPHTIVTVYYSLPQPTPTPH